MSNERTSCGSSGTSMLGWSESAPSTTTLGILFAKS